MTARDNFDRWPERIKATGLSQAEFSRQAGIHEVNLCRYLKRKSTPHIDHYDRIENKLRELGH